MYLRALWMSYTPVSIFTPHFRLYCLTYEQQSTSRTYVCVSLWSQHEVHIFSVATWAFCPYVVLHAVWRGCCGSLTKNHWISLAHSHSFSSFLLFLSLTLSLSLSIVRYLCHGYWSEMFIKKFLNTHFCLVTQYSAASERVKNSSSKCKRKFCKATGGSLFGQNA